MKRNWKIIGALVVFMALWQYLVIKPYADKVRATQVSQKQDTKENTNQTPTAETSQSSAPSSAVNTQEIPSSSSPAGAFVRHDLSKDVDFRVYENGVISHFHLPNYQLQDQKDKDVVLLQEGISWSSTNPKIQECLSQLKSIDTKSNLLFKGTTNEGSCEVRFDLVEHAHTKEIIPSLKLEGFSGAQGTVDFSTKTKSFFEISADGSPKLIAAESMNPHRFMYVINAEKDNTYGEDLFKVELLEGKVSWLSFGDKYFLSAFLPKGSFNPSIFHSFVNNEFKYGFRYPIVNEALAGTEYRLGFFSGPRDTEMLASIDPQLKSAIELGWFESVGRFLLWSLNQLYKLFQNYGVSIIVLTLLVRLLFWPLNKKMFDSGQKMKELQPHLERIRAKYKDDKTRMNEMNMEIMNLYKVHKVNPMGSCLPMLLQIPVFLGLYTSISNSINLYQAPFVGWITDLSAKDPFYVLPVVWTVSMYFTMKLNPQATQTQPGMPNMKYMMYAMYLVFGFISKDWPSGLNLYLVVSNLVGIVQQILFLRASKKTQLVQEGA